MEELRSKQSPEVLELVSKINTVRKVDNVKHLDLACDLFDLSQECGNEDLKNFALSYKNTSSRVSWNYDSINAGRKILVRFAVRGKTLCVYFPLDADNLPDKYKVEKSESKRFEDVPCMYRIHQYF